MCGIVGFFDCSKEMGPQSLEGVIRKMSDRLYHRGPDDVGAWVDPDVGIALGHRRLSIVDLSPLGRQPMESENGRYITVFNGEIYNYKIVRQELERNNLSNFRSHSDTEVLLAAVEAWGIEAAVQRFTGMFAFGIWDRCEHKLYLGRDRLGEKPLYYGWLGKTLVFASELKALRAHPEFRADIDRNVMALYLRYNYIPAPFSIYEGIYKLLPGSIVTVDAGGLPSLPSPYWSLKTAINRGIENPFQGDPETAVSVLDSLLKDSVKQQMIADVPLGAFLSGGIDSSTVVALMQAQSMVPVKTFTIGFAEKDYNEAEYAKAVASHLNTEHTELYVSPQQAMEVIPKLPYIYDEPFSDSSQIPTFLVSALARQHVTVCLSGDGGDELFGGYKRYLISKQMWNIFKRVPGVGRAAVKKLIESISLESWNSKFNWVAPVTALSGRKGPVGDKIYKFAELLTMDNPWIFYRQLISHWKNPEQVIIGAREPLTYFTDQSQKTNLQEFVGNMMYLDTLSYLPDDILVKVDRASMAVSLESRVPFLDHRIVEFAWTLPQSLKLRGSEGKWILRQVLQNYLPKDLIERPKMGFGVPVGTWLRGPLREWAEELLDERRLEKEGFFNPCLIRQKWHEHLSGTRNWQGYLWDILMFQAWFHQQKA